MLAVSWYFSDDHCYISIKTGHLIKMFLLLAEISQALCVHSLLMVCVCFRRFWEPSACTVDGSGLIGKKDESSVEKHKLAPSLGRNLMLGGLGFLQAGSTFLETNFCAFQAFSYRWEKWHFLKFHPLSRAWGSKPDSRLEENCSQKIPWYSIPLFFSLNVCPSVSSTILCCLLQM